MNTRHSNNWEAGEEFKAMLQNPRPKMDKKQNKMQRGFSVKSSSSNTAFLVMEAIAEAKDSKQPFLL